MTQYFQSKLEQARHPYPKHAGKISYWINVDAGGSSCVLYVRDGILDEQLRNDIRQWINEAIWIAPSLSGKSGNTSIFLRFSFNPSGLHVDKIQFGHPDADFHTNTPPDSATQAKALAMREKLQFAYVEQMPRPGFDIPQYLSQTIHYPDSARLSGIEGRVVIKFVVNEDGHLSGAQILKGIGHGCDEEALRAVNAMPKWIPGKQQGKPVKVYFTLPITFKLEEPANEPQLR